MTILRKSFSTRQGLEPAKALAREDISDALKIRIWNTIYEIYLSDYFSQDEGIFFIKLIWKEFMLEDISEFPGSPYQFFDRTKAMFFQLEWAEIYNFLEFLVQIPNSYQKLKGTVYDRNKKAIFIARINNILSEERVVWRYIDTIIADITSQDEVEEISKALVNTYKYQNVKTHLQTALVKLSDKEQPDYRNSIKESISAVEGLTSIITGQSKSDLDSALKELEKSHKLPTPLKLGFIKLYGFTNDKTTGIRHALLEEQTYIAAEDARFMLIACSAFINYVIAKIEKTG